MKSQDYEGKMHPMNSPAALFYSVSPLPRSIAPLAAMSLNEFLIGGIDNHGTTQH